MASQRLSMAAGILFAVAGAGLVALADPDPSVPGSYKLTGSQGGRHTSVKLVVASDGSVSRAVTFDDGSQQTTKATGTFSDPRTLRVTFATSEAKPDDDSTPDPKNLAGAWTLHGQNGVGNYNGTGTFERNGDTWKGVFKYTYDDGSTGSLLIQGKLRGDKLVGTRVRTTGLTGALGTTAGRVPFPIGYGLTSSGLGLAGGYGPGEAFHEAFTRDSVPTGPGASGAGVMAGVYRFDGKGGVRGTLTNSTGGGWTSATESGKKFDEVPLAVLEPAAGTAVLAGQILDVKVTPENASWDVKSGAAKKNAGGRLQVTGDGPVVLVAKVDARESDPVTISSVKPEVVELEVQRTQPIADAAPPHVKRDLGSTDEPAQQPAAILAGETLVVKATLKANVDLGAPAHVTLVATGSNVSLRGAGDVASLKDGATVTLESTAPLSATIAVNKLSLSWSLEQDSATSIDLGSTPLRVYTIYKPTIRNGPYFGEDQHTINTKDHYEKACIWASGTSANVGNGSTSICWNLDNQVRHHVHPIDFKPEKRPFTQAYADDSTPPMNYGDLPDHDDAAETGERPVGQLYYPPLEKDMHDRAKEDYSHYASNFGWWVLDNPTHTGGRCNQQASLMCDLFGTMGIKANVHYLHRVGFGRQTGRPVCQFFNSEKNGTYWNFHGLAEAVMADGQHWLYDGSFSFAPSRKNGLTEWAEAPGRWLNQETPFIYEFGPWYYSDTKVPGSVLIPESDMPTDHVAGNPGRGQFEGVAIANKEKLNWYYHR